VKLNEKQAAKLAILSGKAGYIGIADAKSIRASRKVIADKLKAYDAMLAIIAPPKAETKPY